MVKQIPVGTLVRPKPGALDPRAEYYRYNSEAVAEHGWIYFVVRVDAAVSDDEDWDDSSNRDPYVVYECRALATGKLLRWTNHELEAADDV